MRTHIHPLGRCSALIAVALLAAQWAAPAAAQTDEPKAVAVVAIETYSGLIGDIDFLGGLGGQVKAGQQLENLLKLFTQGQGLNGLNKNSAWGAVVQTDGFQFSPIVCLPVTDLAALKSLVENAQIPMSDAGDGITEIEMPQQSVYIKDGGKWAFISNQIEMLDAAPSDPGKMFGELTGDYDIAVKVMVQNVPDMYRQIAITQMQSGLEEGLEQEDDETDEAFALRKQIANQQMQQMVQLINESDEITLGWNVDGDQGNTHLDLIYTVVPGSELARLAAMAGESKTRFAGFVDDETAVSVIAAQTNPPEAIAAQKDQVTQTIAQFRAQIAKEIENSDDVPNEEAREVLKEAAGSILDSFETTLLSGTLDVGLGVKMDPDAFTLVGGGHLLEAAKIEASLKKLAALIENEPDAPTFDFDAETYQGVRMHHVTIPIPADEEDAQKLFGDSLEVTIGASDDSLYLAAGREHLAALKSAIADSAAAGPKAVKPFEVVASMESIMKVAAAFDDGPGQPMLETVAETLALNSEGATHIRLTGENITNGQKIRFEIEAGVLEAFGKAAVEARRAGAGAAF